MSTQEDRAAARTLLELVNGSWVAQACYVTARLGIADQLAAGPRTAEELAAATGAHATGAAASGSRRSAASISAGSAPDGSFE